MKCSTAQNAFPYVFCCLLDRVTVYVCVEMEPSRSQISRRRHLSYCRVRKRGPKFLLRLIFSKLQFFSQYFLQKQLKKSKYSIYIVFQNVRYVYVIPNFILLLMGSSYKSQEVNSLRLIRDDALMWESHASEVSYFYFLGSYLG